MENSWGEAIPENVNELLAESNKIASILQSKLQANECPSLGDLYKRTYKVIRQKEVFKSNGYVPKNIQTDNPNNKNEYKGLYVFGELINGITTPVYVGISRTIYRRLRQHGFGKKHNECTLAYNIAKLNTDFNKERSEFCENLLALERENMQNFKVALYEVKEDFNLYFHEVAIAAILQTKYNTFKTH